MSNLGKEIKSKYHYKNIYMQVLNGFNNGLNITNACLVAKVTKNQYYTACRKLEKEPITKLNIKQKNNKTTKKTNKRNQSGGKTFSEEIKNINNITLTESKGESKILREKINQKYKELIEK